MTTHDYTKRYWGHDYAITNIRKNGHEIDIMGWGFGLEKKDFILLQSQSQEVGARPDTQYQITDVKYFRDPADLWSVTAIWVPRN